MKTEHTPGPWKWNGQTSLFKIECSGGHVVASASYEGSWLARYNEAEDAANVRLMAAAPDLLEALLNKMGRKSCGHTYDCVCADDMAKAAIALATNPESKPQ